MQPDISSANRQLISMTPLIDVVFILLLFFMLSSTFVQTKYIGIRGAAQSSAQQDTQTRKILITAEDTVVISQISYAINSARLSQQLTRFSHARDAVSVYAKQDIPVRVIVQLLDLGKQHGIATLRLGKSVL